MSTVSENWRILVEATICPLCYLMEGLKSTVVNRVCPYLRGGESLDITCIVPLMLVYFNQFLQRIFSEFLIKLWKQFIISISKINSW